MRSGRAPGGFVGAVQFLTRIPIRTSAPVAHDRAVPWFPLVGALVGGAVGGVFAAMSELVDAPTVAAAIAVAAGMLVTGAFHEDGLADMADAVAGGATRQARLRILDDPRHGTYGVAALASSIVIRVATLAAAGPAVGFAAATSAHTLGRAGAIAAIGRVPSARPSGLGATAAEAVREPSRTIGLLGGTLIAGAATGWWVAVTIPVVALAGGGVVALATRAFGGVNGDVLGAVEQVIEITVMVAVIAIAGHHQIWWR